jgi:sugar/nucleoside kinase (ribokinase family)
MSGILVVGSIALDTVRTPAGSRTSTLGGSASYFALAACRHVPVQVVAVVGTDFQQSHRDCLNREGIDISGLQVAEGRTFRWEGIYSQDMNERTTIATELNVFESFHPVLPDKYRGSKAVFLANIDPLLQEEVLDQLSDPWLVALDTMNYWISNRPDDLIRVLRRVHIFLINDSEARQLTGAENVLKAAEGIRMMGPSVVVIKRGEYGALARTENGWFHMPAYPVDGLKDPTGAGDSFAGGMLGRLALDGNLEEKSIRRAIGHGTAIASFAVEEFGVEGLIHVREADLLARVRDLRDMTRFDPD